MRSGCHRHTRWAKRLARYPQKLVVFTVDIEDISHGVTLTPAVAAAVPAAVEVILAELQQDSESQE